MGGGFENTNFYTNTVLEFLNIANIHAMRESLNKVQNITDLGATWMSQLENTNWLEHIRYNKKNCYTLLGSNWRPVFSSYYYFEKSKMRFCVGVFFF